MEAPFVSSDEPAAGLFQDGLETFFPLDPTVPGLMAIDSTASATTHDVRQATNSAGPTQTK